MSLFRYDAFAIFIIFFDAIAYDDDFARRCMAPCYHCFAITMLIE